MLVYYKKIALQSLHIFSIPHETSPSYNFLKMCKGFSIGLLYKQIKEALWNRMGCGGGGW